jgi:hypothetical protein
MPRHLRIRPGICAAAAVAATIAASAPAAVAATSYTRCRSADLRYPFQPGGPNDFGVFRLKIAGGGCTTAHRVAKKWMHRFEANLSNGHVRLPRSVEGFAFQSLPPNEAQTYRLRGRRNTTTIHFSYRVPNG